jgi:peptidyl-tRNA hydrolase
MNKIKCPLCHRGVESITNKNNQKVFQKHIGLGIFRYGQSKGKSCWSSFKSIERTDIPEIYKKEVEFWNNLLKKKWEIK